MVIYWKRGGSGIWDGRDRGGRGGRGGREGGIWVGQLRQYESRLGCVDRQVESETPCIRNYAKMGEGVGVRGIWILDPEHILHL